MATFTWAITQMIAIPQYEQYQDVVVTATWQCNGEQVDNGETYFGQATGVNAFALPTTTFTPYADLTQDQVMQWCIADGLNQADQEAIVQAQIDNAINPPTVALPLPWVNQP